jgi:hypothetical protein
VMLPNPDHWFLDMEADDARRIVELGHCKVGQECGCWWNRRLASAERCLAVVSEQFAFSPRPK